MSSECFTNVPHTDRRYDRNQMANFIFAYGVVFFWRLTDLLAAFLIALLLPTMN